MTKRDLVGLLAALAVYGAMAWYRGAVVESAAWGAFCDVAAPPWPCAPRQAVGWSGYWQLFGLGALALGVWAFLGAPFAVRVAAVALGAVAVVNYNVTWGVLAATLGAWAWIGARRPAG